MSANGLVGSFEEARPALRRYLLARGCGDETDDILQELWLKAAAAGEAGHVEEPLSYLYRMAHNLLLDRVRTRRRRGDREQAFHDLQFGLSGACVQPSVERTLLAREQLLLVERALVTLGPRAEMIFRRHRLDRVPQQQIATELGVTLSAVEKQLQRAYRAIAASLRRYHEESSFPRAEEDLSDGR